MVWWWLSVQWNVAPRESYYKWLVRVEGLNYSDSRQLTERLGEAGERLADRDITEFTLPSWMLLNALESIGYSVVIVVSGYVVKLKWNMQVISSDQLVTGASNFDVKEFLWTLKKGRDIWVLIMNLITILTVFDVIYKKYVISLQ